MKNFSLVAANVDVTPLLLAVQRQPDLWDAHRWRMTYEGTPHLDVSDIWLRYSDDAKTADTGELQGVQQDMKPIFHDAWHRLPQARSMVLDLMRRVDGYELGRVLITKLPPGGRILAHADADGAYTNSGGARFHVVLQGLPGSLYTCGSEAVMMLTGSVWWSNHLKVHSVANNSEDDRIHLLVDFLIAP